MKHDTTKREVDDKRAETKPQSKFQRPRAPRGATRAPEARRDAAPPARDPLEAYHGHADARSGSNGREKDRKATHVTPAPPKALPSVAFGTPAGRFRPTESAGDVPRRACRKCRRKWTESRPKADRKRTERVTESYAERPFRSSDRGGPGHLRKTAGDAACPFAKRPFYTPQALMDLIEYALR